MQNISTWQNISNGKNLKIKPNDSNFNNKQIAYCPDLPFRIISFNSFVNIETMNIISSDVDVNGYELISTKSDELVKALKQLRLPHFLDLLDNYY